MDPNLLTTLIVTIGGIITLLINQRYSFRKASEDRDRAELAINRSASVINKELTPNSGGSLKDCVDNLTITQATQLSMLGQHGTVLSTLVLAMQTILKEYMPSPFTDEQLRQIRSTPAARCKIMIVDDERDILESFRHLLRPEFEVFVAVSAADAMQILAKNNDVHVVVTDQRMPEMNGAEFLKVLCERFPMPVRIVLTGYADIKAVIASINDGHVYGYLTKPVDEARFLGMVREAAAQYAILHDLRRQ